MKLYNIKIALRGASPMVWRRLRIPGDTSLAQLHAIIQIAYNWDDEYLHQFHIYGKDYGISYPGGITFSEDPYKISLDDFEFDVRDKFTYEYNFFAHWLVDIRIEAIKELSSKSAAVYCTKGNGMPGVNKSDELEPMMNLLKAIADIDKNTTVDDIRPLVDTLNAVRFNRQYTNYRLRNELNR